LIGSGGSSGEVILGGAPELAEVRLKQALANSTSRVLNRRKLRPASVLAFQKRAALGLSSVLGRPSAPDNARQKFPYDGRKKVPGATK
jgi:hypothetical protein